jgi:hypothetical protein
VYQPDYLGVSGTAGRMSESVGFSPRRSTECKIVQGAGGHGAVLCARLMHPSSGPCIFSCGYRGRVAVTIQAADPNSTP